MVTDLLRDLITGRQLSPDTPLRQRNLAEQFDVSYTPVREALRRLESEGLVVTDVHLGATVARTEPEELEENYRILAALEALAGSLAVAKITDDDIADIEALYQEVAACLPDDDRLAELNRQFHFRIYECARSPMLLLLMRLLWRSFPHGPQAGRPHQESVRQHDALVRAPKHRNEEQAAAIIRDHVIGSIKAGDRAERANLRIVTCAGWLVRILSCRLPVYRVVSAANGGGAGGEGPHW